MTASEPSPTSESARQRVAITGASGLIGSALAPLLERHGFDVLRLVRRAPGRGEIEWDPADGRIDARALGGVAAVVHLAGENLAGRWTAGRRRRIVESRRDGTALIARTLAGLQDGPRILVSASAIGAYGERGDAVLDDASTPGAGFLADVVRIWEGSADPARAAGVRVIHPRFGLVLSPRGGALQKLLIPFRLGVGAPLGNGRQWMSCVSVDDTVGAVLHAIRTADLAGPVNVTMPEPIRNADFTRTLAGVLRRPSLPIGVPAALLRAVLGQLADETVLQSTRVVPRRLEASGFRFQHPTVDAALRHVLGAPSR